MKILLVISDSNKKNDSNLIYFCVAITNKYDTPRTTKYDTIQDTNLLCGNENFLSQFN